MQFILMAISAILLCLSIYLIMDTLEEEILLALLIILAILTGLFWIGYHVTGALLSAAIWFFIKLPFALILGCLGLVCCITILLIPLGGKCFKFAFEVLT